MDSIDNLKTLSNGILYLELDGSEGRYEMGLQHGRALRERICSCIDYVKASYERELGGRTEAFLHRLLSETGYLADAKRYLPNIYEEMQGIADGCGRPLEDVYLINCLDEGYYLMLEESACKCTCLGIQARGSRPNMLGQNLDFEDAYNGYQTVFRIRLPEHEFLLYGFCGQLMGMGMNERGISVIANAVGNGRISLEHGVSNTLMQRAFYECESVEECLDLLKSCPRSTATAYTIADFNTVRCFEATAGEVAEVPPCVCITAGTGEAAGCAHTNHLLASTDTRDAAGVCERQNIYRDENGLSWEMTEERLLLAQKFVREHCTDCTEKEIMEFLSTPPVLRDYGQETIQSFVSVSDPQCPRIYVAGDRNNRGFVRLDLFQAD